MIDIQETHEAHEARATRESAEPDVNLPAFLAARARSASDLRLALHATLGVLILLLSLVWETRAAFFAGTLGVVLLTFGSWGMADRELSERGGESAPARVRRLLRATKWVAAAAGGAAAALLAVRMMAIVIGRVIS